MCLVCLSRDGNSHKVDRSRRIKLKRWDLLSIRIQCTITYIVEVRQICPPEMHTMQITKIMYHSAIFLFETVFNDDSSCPFSVFQQAYA